MTYERSQRRSKPTSSTSVVHTSSGNTSRTVGGGVVPLWFSRLQRWQTDDGRWQRRLFFSTSPTATHEYDDGDDDHHADSRGRCNDDDLVDVRVSGSLQLFSSHLATVAPRHFVGGDVATFRQADDAHDDAFVGRHIGHSKFAVSQRQHCALFERRVAEGAINDAKTGKVGDVGVPFQEDGRLFSFRFSDDDVLSTFVSGGPLILSGPD